MSAFICKVNQFQGSAARPATTDKNGFAPVILVARNGNLPEKARVISGTVAHRAGLEVGKIYAIDVTMDHVDDQYGEQYTYNVVGEISTIEALTNKFELGVVQKNTAPAATKEPIKVMANDDDDEDEKPF